MAATYPVVPADARLIDSSLFGDDRQHLRASICRTLDNLASPAQGSCARCTGTDVETTLLERRGWLWGCTIQRFVPKTPYLVAEHPGGAPHGVGYVEQADVEHRSMILVEARLPGADVDRLEVGVEMDLAFELLPAADGGDVWAFAFAPGGAIHGELAR